MPFRSPHADISIPQCNVLDYLFPEQTVRDIYAPLWHDASDPSLNLSIYQQELLVKSFAAGLDALEIPRDAAVMIFSTNNLYVPTVYMGAAGSLRYFTGANPTYTADEAAYQMNVLNPGIVLIHPDLLVTGIKAASKAKIPKSKLYIFGQGPASRELQQKHGLKDWWSILIPSHTASSYAWPKLTPAQALKQIACINFSSGTTGLPKGVMISHANLIANAAQTIAHKFSTISANDNPNPLSEASPGEERWLAFLPLYHAYSQLWTINIAARLGYKVYVMQKFVFEDWLRFIEKYKVNTIQGVPPVMIMMTKRPETKKYDISSLKNYLSGAAPTGRELQAEMTRRFNLRVMQGWGMTETTCGAAMEGFGQPDDKSGTIGYLLPNTEGILLDEQGKEVTEEGERGELCIRGPQMLMGYYKNLKATRESFDKEGYFKTGDVAIRRKDKKGRDRLWIVDRKKELIKVKGLQVAPAELEACLLDMEAVADVAVTGITLEGEEWPRAYVMRQTGHESVGEDEVKKFVEGRMSKHKWLAGGVMFVDEVPKLPSGKIMRKVMRDWSKRDAQEMEKSGGGKAKL